MQSSDVIKLKIAVVAIMVLLMIFAIITYFSAANVDNYRGYSKTISELKK